MLSPTQANYAKNFLQEQPHTTLILTVHMNFRKINFFVAAIDYENIFTTKIPDLWYTAEKWTGVILHNIIMMIITIVVMSDEEQDHVISEHTLELEYSSILATWEKTVKLRMGILMNLES